MKTSDWKDISYLEKGTESQRRAFDAITKHEILDSLSSYHPVLVSTVCVDLDIEGSDLDIICQHNNQDELKSTVKSLFGTYRNFRQWVRESDSNEAVACFHVDGFDIEIFGSIVSVEAQFVYRHLSMMARILEIGGEVLRERVRAIKMSGSKTEPAFARILGLPGDPFLAFLELEQLDDVQLDDLVRKSL